MLFQTYGEKCKPAVLFFHAMGVTGASSEPVAKHLQSRCFCILPTSTVYCAGQTYRGKADEVRQVEDFLTAQGIGHVFFDGGQFAQIGCATRHILTPFLYLAIKSLYWSRGGTLKKIMWCDDDGIKPYFMAAGKNLRYGNMRRQIADSLEDKPFPPMPEDWQKRAFFEFGSIEEHMKYRPAVMQAYPAANFPIFADFNHIQYQIRDPKGFADMLISIMDAGKLPELPFIKA